MSHSLPREKRVHFPDGLVSRSDEAANTMLAELSQALDNQYGLHLILGAEQEYSIGPVSSINRTSRATRLFRGHTAYDDLALGSKAHDWQGFFKSAQTGNFRRQFVLPLHAQKEEGAAEKAFADLRQEKREEIKARFREKLQDLDTPIDPKDPEAVRQHLNRFVTELQLMGQTLYHRLTFGRELRALRELRITMGDDLTEFTDANIEATRKQLQSGPCDLGFLMESLVVDLDEALTKPTESEVYANHPAEGKWLFEVTPQIRTLLVKAYLTGDPAIYDQIKETYMLNGDIPHKKSSVEKPDNLVELDNETIDKMAYRLIRNKICDRAAVNKLIDHHSSVVRRKRPQAEQLEKIETIIYGEDDPKNVLDEFDQVLLYGNMNTVELVESKYIGMANQINRLFNLGLEDAQRGMPVEQTRDHMRKILRQATLKEDFSISEEDLKESQEALKAYLEFNSRGVDQWTVAAIAQRERAWRQTEMRELPEFKAGLKVISERIKGLESEKRAAIWAAIADNIEENYTRRTYGYGSKLDAEGVVANSLIESLEKEGISVDNDMEKALREYITCSSYAIADLLVRDWRRQVEEVYDKIKDIVKKEDETYFKLLPDDAVMDMHIEGGGAEVAREAVTTPLPAEINRVMSRVMSGMLEGTLGDSITFVDHKGKKHDIDLSQSKALCDEYPELFFNAHAYGWQQPVGQHVHYSSVAQDGEGNTLTPYEINEDGDTRPSDFAYYSHLAVLKLGPEFRAALGNSEDSLNRWLYGFASPDHFRALYLPEDTPGFHQITRASGDAIKIFKNHGEMRAASSTADTRFLHAFLAIAQQHACDNYVLDKLAEITGQAITAANLQETLSALQKTPEKWAPLKDDVVVSAVFKQNEQARQQWLERVGKQLEQGIIVPGELAERLTQTKSSPELMVKNSDKVISVLAYETVKEKRVGFDAGPSIVGPEERSMMKHAADGCDKITQKWQEELAISLHKYMPGALATQLGNALKPSRQING